MDLVIYDFRKVDAQSLYHRRAISPPVTDSNYPFMVSLSNHTPHKWASFDKLRMSLMRTHFA